MNYSENKERVASLRSTLAARWPGDAVYNTHHDKYQFYLPPYSKFWQVEPFLIEFTDAQFELWVHRTREARKMVQEVMGS